MSSIPVPFAPAAVRVRDRLRDFSGAPAWARPATLLLALATFVLYAWGLDRNGFANTYYSAAVLAGTQSWKAFFFGSLDAGNFITVDKPPASLWLMELSARLFGLNSWSLLLPEALAGALCVLLVVLTVRRAFGPLAGLVAGAVTALTPVAVLMFRYNNPDALLTLLLVASAWALTHALDGGRLRWLLVSAGFVGLAFNTKDLQAYIVVPALVLTYFLFAPGAVRRRFLHLLGAAGVLLVSSGWWMAIVDVIPAASRPYIGGSTDNSVLDLVLGYNGLGRVFGQGGPGGGGNRLAAGGNGFGGAAGLLRLFNTEIGGQISWLLPFSGVALAAGLWLQRRAPRTSPERAGYVLWGGWLLTHFLVFSFASGIFHPYYTVAMAPAVGALVGAGVLDLWKLRGRSIFGAALLAAALSFSGWWAAQLLGRTPSLSPWLAALVLFLALAAAIVILVTRLPAFSRLYSSRLPVAALVVGTAALLLGPAAYSVETVANSYSGAIPSAGPSAAAGFDFRGGGPSAISSQLAAYLEQNQGGATWLVAVQGAQEAAALELETRKPVLAMGGFSGDPAPTAEQLQQLVNEGKLRYVLLGGIGGPGGSGRVFGPPQGGAFEGPPPGATPNLGDGRLAPGGRSSATQAAVQWVQQSCTPVTDAGVSGLYDCSSAAG